MATAGPSATCWRAAPVSASSDKAQLAIQRPRHSHIVSPVDRAAVRCVHRPSWCIVRQSRYGPDRTTASILPHRQIVRALRCHAAQMRQCHSTRSCRPAELARAASRRCRCEAAPPISGQTVSSRRLMRGLQGYRKEASVRDEPPASKFDFAVFTQPWTACRPRAQWRQRQLRAKSGSWCLG